MVCLCCGVFVCLWGLEFHGAACHEVYLVWPDSFYRNSGIEHVMLFLLPVTFLQLNHVPTTNIRYSWYLPCHGMVHLYKYRPLIRVTFIHSVFCLTTVPKPPPKWFCHIVRSRASSFKWEYPLLSLESSSSFLCLLPRLLVTSISPFIFPSITCFRRQFLRKMWPIQLAFHFLISCRIFLCSLTLSNTS